MTDTDARATAAKDAVERRLVELLDEAEKRAADWSATVTHAEQALIEKRSRFVKARAEAEVWRGLLEAHRGR